jgi:hypothetical protein
MRSKQTMKRTMTAFGVAAVACWALSGSVQAQSTTAWQGGSSAGQSGSMHSSQSGKSSKTVRLTGCLQADPSGVGYILTNVTESDMSSSSAGTSTSGQTGTSGSGSSGTYDEQPGASGWSRMSNSVELVGKSTELKSMVGHRIEVTGTPSGKSSKLSGMPGSSAESGTSGSSGTSGGSASGSGSTMGQEESGSSGGMSDSQHWMGQKIRIDSVRQIASSCSAE